MLAVPVIFLCDDIFMLTLLHGPGNPFVFHGSLNNFDGSIQRGKQIVDPNLQAVGRCSEVGVY